MSSLTTAISTVQSALAVVLHVLRARQMPTSELLAALADVDRAAKQLAGLVEQARQAEGELKDFAEWVDYTLGEKARRNDALLIAPNDATFFQEIDGQEVLCLQLKSLPAHHHGREITHASLLPGYEDGAPYLVLGPPEVVERTDEAGNVDTAALGRAWYSREEVLRRTQAEGQRQRDGAAAAKRRVPLPV